MAASNKTVDSVIASILSFIDIKTAIDLSEDLLKIEGNRSFKNTITMINRKLSEMKAERRGNGFRT